MNKQVSTAKIYLGTPFYNDDQRARVDKARALLEENPTVVRVHFPFDQNFVDPAFAAWLGALPLITMTWKV